MPNLEGFMRLELRAQSQCRTTLDALANIKNPPVVYARQANVTSGPPLGPQQIISGVAASPARETETKQSKLLEALPHERLDSRAATTTGGVNQALETVAAVDRAENNRGQEASGTQCLQRRRAPHLENDTGGFEGTIRACGACLKVTPNGGKRYHRNRG